MEKSLVCKTMFSDKFWKTKIQGNFFIVSYGKAGTNGSVNTKEFATEELCLKEAVKLIQSKLKKGYREVGKDEEQQVESAMMEKDFWNLLKMAKRKGHD